MILVAPTAFKGTLSAAEAARAVAAGVRRAAPGEDVVVRPLADGGNGLLDALAAAGPAELRRASVAGPLGRAVDARLLVRRGDVVLETADACGLHLLDAAERDPMRASTRGVGELVLAALAVAADAPPGRALRLGLGGSATVDGGAGMAAALGWSLIDPRGRPIPPGGEGLLRLDRILPPAEPPPLPRVDVLVDVRNPLLGPDGAARVFGPQKGADAEAVARLEDGLARLAGALRRDLGVDVASFAGGGAAGGLGAAAVAFLGARVVPGSDWVLGELAFDALLRRARLLVTGEGAWDEQSGMGKVAREALDRARAAGVPGLLLAGRLRAAAPAGVLALDGGGAIVDAERLAELAEAGSRRILGR